MIRRTVLTEELVQIIRKQHKQVVLFGAGETAEIIFDNLFQYNVDVAFFVDNNVDKQGRYLKNTIIKAPIEIESEMIVVIASIRDDRIEKIEEQLIQLNVKNIYLTKHCIKNDLLKLRNYFSKQSLSTNPSEYDERFNTIIKHYGRVSLIGFWASSIGESAARYLDILDIGAVEKELCVYIPFIFRHETEYCNWEWLKKFSEKIYITLNLKDVLFWEYVLDNYLEQIVVDNYGKHFIQKAIVHGGKNDREKYLLKLNEEDEERAGVLLKKLKLELGSSMVCIANRDSKYYEQRGDNAYNIKRDEIRNADLNSYTLGINHLIQNDYQVVRMGKKSAERCNIDKVYDYSWQEHEDLLDIYIVSKCKFFLSNFSGIFFFPMMLDRPIAICNAFCVSLAGRGCLYGEKNIYIPKLYKRKDGTYLNLWEMFIADRDSWDDGCKFEEAGLSVEANTEEDIYDLVIEMEKRLDNVWVKDELEDEYDQLVQRWISSQELSNPYKDPDYARIFDKKDYNDLFFPGKIGATFLRKHKFLLEC